eukprot:4749532-Pleurochrysis_carterae.AAC.7
MCESAKLDANMSEPATGRHNAGRTHRRRFSTRSRRRGSNFHPICTDDNDEDGNASKTQAAHGDEGKVPALAAGLITCRLPDKETLQRGAPMGEYLPFWLTEVLVGGQL